MYWFSSVICSHGQHLRWHTTLHYSNLKAVCHYGGLTTTVVTFRKSTPMNAAFPTAQTLSPAGSSRSRNSRESNVLSSPPTRRNLFLILFSLLTHCHCGTLLPSNKIQADVFSVFCGGWSSAPLRPWRNDWKVTLLPALSDSTQIVFSENSKGWVYAGGEGALHRWYKTLSDEQCQNS